MSGQRYRYSGCRTLWCGRQDGDVPAPGVLFVLVSGPPASGKSTVAPAIAARLGLPLVAEDTIKDALMSVLRTRRCRVPAAGSGSRGGDAGSRQPVAELLGGMDYQHQL
jgi:hypothetical protein